LIPASAEAAVSETIVSAAALTKRYRHDGTETLALADVTFRVAAGSFAVVVGKSGSGKTTLLNLMGGLDTPSSGSLAVAGLDLGRLRDRELARYRNERVGMVFQSFNLRHSESALENVLTPFFFARGRAHDARRRAEDALAAVGLADLAGQRAGTLSAGQRQRVAIARAIVREPPLLLADEPTGNLDAETGGEVIDLVRRLNREMRMTVFIATHDPELTAAADFVLALRDGRPVDAA
jgi:putative ABC transport system ATP-binding protein